MPPLLNPLPKTGKGGLWTTNHPVPYDVGHQATLRCGEGYQNPVDGVSTVELSGGQLVWIPHRIDCQPLSELEVLPETNEAGQFKCNESPPYHYGDRAVLSCAMGYLPPTNVTSTVVVEEDKLVWSPPKILCNPVQCLPPYIPAHARVSNRSYHFPKRFHYVCEEGYQLNQRRIEYWCTVKGEWFPSIPANIECEPVQCPQLQDPENGTVSFYDRSFGAVATFTCQPHYMMLKGQKRRECQGDGTWSGEEVVCGRIPCPPMDPSVKVAYVSERFNTVDCGEGKTVNVRCNPNGQWSFIHPYCNLVADPHPPNVLPPPQPPRVDPPPPKVDPVDPPPPKVDPVDPPPPKVDPPPQKPFAVQPKTSHIKPSHKKSHFPSLHQPSLSKTKYFIIGMVLVISLCLFVLVYGIRKRTL